MDIDKKKIKGLKRIAKKGDIKAIKELAGMYPFGSAQYLSWYTKAGKLGDLYAQRSMAEYYYVQASIIVGVSSSYAAQNAWKVKDYLNKAEEWYEKASSNPAVTKNEKTTIEKKLSEIKEILWHLC